MAFRRNYRRGPRPKGFRRRTPLAHVRRTWIQSMLLDVCDPQLVPLCVPTVEQDCCTTRWEQVIVDNAILQSQFSDRARVVRILGDFVVLFDTGTPATQQEIYDRYAAAFGDLYVQLIKRPINMNTGAAELPGDIWDGTNLVDAYSESKALKTWWHHWVPLNGFSVAPSSLFSAFDGEFENGVWKPQFINCTNQIVGLWGSLAGGTGTVGASAPPCTPLSPPVEPVQLGGECDNCPGNANNLHINHLGQQSMLRAPGAWHMKFDIKKRIPLREDEQLNLDFQFRSFYPSVFNNGQMVMLSGGIKTLIEF